MGFSSDPAMQSNQLALDVEFDKEKEEFNDVLNLQYRRIVDSMNTKEGALYQIQELNTFKQVYGYDPLTIITPPLVPSPQVFRNVYRMTIDFVNGPNSWGPITTGSPIATINISQFAAVKDAVLIYASCKNADNRWFTLTWPLAYLTPTQAVINNTTGNTITQAMFVAEYTKN